MKTKNKILAVVEIAIVLCSLFLVAIPAIAAEQSTQEVSAAEITTASEDDYVLGVYGNANEDDTIDMRDLTYVKLIFFGKKPETELADAKYDGKINPLDFIQIKLIIVGKEKELTIVDSAERIVTVKKPVTGIIILVSAGADAIRVLEAEKSVVGVSSPIAKEKVLLPVMSEAENVGSFSNPDYEAILALKPDIVIAYATYGAKIEEKLEPYATVVCLDFRGKTMVEDMKKLGYTLDKTSEAEEFCDWHDDYIDMIKDRTKGFSEEDKPRVFLENAIHHKKYYTGGKKCAEGYICEMAGGINIAADKPSSGVVDSEWVVVQNPDFIMVGARSSYPSGYGVDDITGVKAKREEVMNRPELKKINAVKNGNVYCTASDIVHGIQSFISITYWTKWFHPTLFEDLDPHAIQKEYLTRFQRIDYDIDKHGIFVYHPEKHPEGH